MSEALSSAKLTSVKREFEGQWSTFLSLDITEPLCRAAGELAERYGLRGVDSIHLATFTEVARRAGTDDTRFSSFDDRLNRAAGRMTQALKRGR